MHGLPRRTARPGKAAPVKGNWHHLRVSTPDETARNGRVWLDGKELHGVTHVRIRLGVREPNSVLLRLFVKAVDADVGVRDDALKKTERSE